MYHCDACRLYVNANSFILLHPVHQYFEVLEFLDTSTTSDCQYMLDYFGVSVLYRNLTWATGSLSLTCVCDILSIAIGL